MTNMTTPKQFNATQTVARLRRHVQRATGPLVSLNKQGAPIRVAQEWREQAAVMCWALLHARLEPRLSLLYHIPNGEKRPGAAAAKLKAMGVKPHMPDLHLPVPKTDTDPSRIWCSCYIEMKRLGGRTPSTEQVACHQRLRSYGNYVHVAFGWLDAVQHLCWYLGREDLCRTL
jgi:hypothetical protein